MAHRNRRATGIARPELATLPAFTERSEDVTIELLRERVSQSKGYSVGHCKYGRRMPPPSVMPALPGIPLRYYVLSNTTSCELKRRENQ
jgi:hypothetical protein